MTFNTHENVPVWVQQAFQSRIDDGSVNRYVFCSQYIIYAEKKDAHKDDPHEMWSASISSEVWDKQDKKNNPITLDKFKIERL